MGEPLEPSGAPPEEPSKKESKEYEVGYGRPPIETRFKKGRSGNSKGRPKMRRSLQAELNRELKQKVVINENGTRKQITKRQAIVKRLVNDAIKGESPRLLWPHLLESEEELFGEIKSVGGTVHEQLAELTQRLRARILVRQQAERD